MKKRFFFVLVALSGSLLLAACQQKQPESYSKNAAKNEAGNKVGQDEYRTEFTEQELTDGQAVFDVMDNLKLDAVMTPKEVYEKTYNSYYMKHIFDKGNAKDDKKLKSHTILYGKDISEVYQMISKKLLGSFDEKSVDWTNNGALTDFFVDFHGENDMDYRCLAAWSVGNRAFDDSTLYYPEFTMQAVNGPYAEALERGYAEELRQYLPKEKHTGSALAEGKKLGEDLQHFLENMLERPINPSWDWVAVNPKRLEMLNEVLADSEMPKVNTDIKEYYSYCFYYDIDGLPYENLVLQYQLKGGEKATKEAGFGSFANSRTLYALNEPGLKVSSSSDGIIYLQTDNYRTTGEIYKEGQKVKSVSEILKNIVAYYETKLLIEPVTITEMKLVYGGYFTDAKDGDIDNAIAPFWKVTVYDEKVGMNLYFIYNAVTGEALKEGSS